MTSSHPSILRIEMVSSGIILRARSASIARGIRNLIAGMDVASGLRLPMCLARVDE